jgi:hypothetical protein
MVATLAAGESCAPNLRGREFGILRNIQLSAAGRAHPQFDGKTEVLHVDRSQREVAAELGLGAELLDERSRTREVENWLRYVVNPRSDDHVMEKKSRPPRVSHP